MQRRRKCCRVLLAFLLAGLLLPVVPGCSPRIVERAVIQRDTIRVVSAAKDSVTIRDSVFIREKGDTIYIYKERYRDRIREKHDTIVRVKVDSFAVEVPREVKVSEPLSRWESLKIRGFWPLLVCCLLLLAWVTRRWWSRF